MAARLRRIFIDKWRKVFRIREGIVTHARDRLESQGQAVRKYGQEVQWTVGFREQCNEGYIEYIHPRRRVGGEAAGRPLFRLNLRRTPWAQLELVQTCTGSLGIGEDDSGGWMKTRAIVGQVGASIAMT